MNTHRTHGLRLITTSELLGSPFLADQVTGPHDGSGDQLAAHLGGLPIVVTRATQEGPIDVRPQFLAGHLATGSLFDLDGSLDRRGLVVKPETDRALGNAKQIGELHLRDLGFL